MHETHRELLERRYKARKALYEQQKEAHLKLLGDMAEFGIASVRRPIGGGRMLPRKRWVERPMRGVRPPTIRPEPEERPPLVDVIDEGEHLRIDVQFKNIPWPEDIVGELKEVSFKHGVLELRLKKRKELTPKEKRALESAEVEKVTAKVKEKLMLKLKQKPLEAGDEETERHKKKVWAEDLGLKGL